MLRCRIQTPEEPPLYVELAACPSRGDLLHLTYLVEVVQVIWHTRPEQALGAEVTLVVETKSRQSRDFPQDPPWLKGSTG